MDENYGSQPHFLRFPIHNMSSPIDNNVINDELSPIKKKKARKLGSRRPKGAESHHKANMPEARCAYFHRTKEEWRARYVEDTKRKMKCFSLKRYKNEHALTLAECFLSEMQRTHKVPHDNDINIWYDYILRMSNHSNSELKSHSTNENSHVKSIKGEDPTDVIGLLIREQRTHHWLADGSIQHVPPIGPWGESQLLREAKKKPTPQTPPTPEIYNNQTSYPSNQTLQSLLYFQKNPTIKQNHENNLRHRYTCIPTDIRDSFEKSQEATHSYQHTKLNRDPDGYKEDGSLNNRLPSKLFEAPSSSNMRHLKKEFLRQTGRNYIPMEPNLEMMNKKQSPHLPHKSKPARQIAKPGPSNGIRLPRSPSLPPEKQEYEEVQNIDSLLSHFAENPRNSNHTQEDKKHRYTSLPSIITRCAKSRRKFWDMRYSEDVNYKNTDFEQLITPEPIDKKNNLETNVISIAKSFDALEPPQHLLSLPTTKPVKSESELVQDIKHPYSSILSLEPNSLQAPIINFELLSKQNRYTILPNHYNKESNGNLTNSTDLSPKISHHSNDTQIHLSRFTSAPQANKDLKDNQFLKIDSNLNIKNNYTPTSETIFNQNDMAKNALDNGDQLTAPANYDLENQQDPKAIKVEVTPESHPKTLEDLSSLMKSFAETRQSGLSDLTRLLKSDMSEKEIENLLISQLSRPDFPTSEIDLESILNISQMEEHNASTAGKLKYLRTLDEQLGRTLIEEENLHTALYFYLKLKNMKLSEIQLFEKTLAKNCSIAFENNQFKLTPTLESDNQKLQESEEMNNDQSNNPTNDLEELLNLESLHIISEALMDEKQRTLDTLCYHMNFQLEKLNQFLPHILDSHLSNILRGDCYFPQKELIGIKEDKSIDQSTIKESHQP